MTPFRLALAAGLLLAGPVAAGPAPDDPRIRDLTYAPDAVYRVTGGFRTATQIVFSPRETIRHAAIGDSLAWEVAAEGSVLFLKPRERQPATNLLVVTERDGALRHYAFELAARESGDRGGTLYQVRFHYPDDEAAERQGALAAAARIAEARVIGLELQQGAISGPRNLAYSVQGDPGLQPSEVSDNGRFTVLRFPGGQPIPPLFEIGEDGAERLVPYDVRGEFVVVHGVARGLRLRRGSSVLCLFNDAFDPRGRGLGTGTASPVVDRAPVGDPS